MGLAKKQKDEKKDRDFHPVKQRALKYLVSFDVLDKTWIIRMKKRKSSINSTLSEFRSKLFGRFWSDNFHHIYLFISIKYVHWQFYKEL